MRQNPVAADIAERFASGVAGEDSRYSRPDPRTSTAARRLNRAVHAIHGLTPEPRTRTRAVAASGMEIVGLERDDPTS